MEILTHFVRVRPPERGPQSGQQNISAALTSCLQSECCGLARYHHTRTPITWEPGRRGKPQGIQNESQTEEKEMYKKHDNYSPILKEENGDSRIPPEARLPLMSREKRETSLAMPRPRTHSSAPFLSTRLSPCSKSLILNAISHSSSHLEQKIGISETLEKFGKSLSLSQLWHLHQFS